MEDVEDVTSRVNEFDFLFFVRREGGVVVKGEVRGEGEITSRPQVTMGFWIDGLVISQIGRK